MAGARHVLIVDDDPSIRMLCRVNLELDGHRAAEAASLAEARDRLAAEPVDVVILDVHIGSDNGLSFLEELRRDRPALGVAVLSGTADRTSVEAAGPDAVIGKPFTLDELKDVVELLGAGRPAAGR